MSIPASMHSVLNLSYHLHCFIALCPPPLSAFRDARRELPLRWWRCRDHRSQSGPAPHAPQYPHPPVSQPGSTFKAEKRMLCPRRPCLQAVGLKLACYFCANTFSPSALRNPTHSLLLSKCQCQIPYTGLTGQPTQSRCYHSRGSCHQAVVAMVGQFEKHK